MILHRKHDFALVATLVFYFYLYCI